MALSSSLVMCAACIGRYFLNPFMWIFGTGGTPCLSQENRNRSIAASLRGIASSSSQKCLKITAAVLRPTSDAHSAANLAVTATYNASSSEVNCLYLLRYKAIRLRAAGAPFPIAQKTILLQL